MATGFMRAILLRFCSLASAAPPRRAADVALIGVIGDKAAVLRHRRRRAEDRQGRPEVERHHACSRSSTSQRHGRDRRQAARADASASTTAAARPALAEPPERHARRRRARPFHRRGRDQRRCRCASWSTPAPPSSRCRRATRTRLGIDYRKGAARHHADRRRRRRRSTASGSTACRLGGIELNGVDGVVIEQGLDIALLGMSFLNRVEMRRDGPDA